ncbi:MAG TPA: hypothetical protein VKV24_01810 [Casimicrobiaceae bacterium]|nr:hypothetical protein [Casimicrobiaceae bacterium]
MSCLAAEARATHDKLMQERAARRARFGDLREPLTAVASSYNAVVTGDELSWSPEEQWRYLADFSRLRPHVWFGVVEATARPTEGAMHPAVDWEDRTTVSGRDEPYVMRPDGPPHTYKEQIVTISSAPNRDITAD